MREAIKNKLQERSLLIFSRSDHPKGYGFGDTAHGYVIVAVASKPSHKEKIIEILDRTYGWSEEIGQAIGWEGINKELTDWYGGHFDLVAEFTGMFSLVKEEYDIYPIVRSYGDNRCFAFYYSEDIIEGDKNE
jgi:hypothetical protein